MFAQKTLVTAHLKSKRRAAPRWGAVGLSLAAALLLASGLAAREVAITILHTADLHGHVAAVGSEREKKPGGGLLRCAGLINKIRAREPNVILVDCGDFFQGAPESFITQGRIVSDAARLLRYDALVPGNHEFDGGGGALIRFYEQARVPVLAANIGASRVPALPGLAPFLCRDVDGVRVAVLGLTTPLIPMWSRPHLLGDMTFEGSLAALRRVMPLARARKPDILVLAAHQGWRKWGDDAANEINAIARAFPEFDLILGAHTHQAVERETVSGVTYTQAGCYGLWLGSARLVFDTQVRRVTSKQVKLLAVDSAVPPDKALENRAAKSLKATKTYLNRAVGVAAVELKSRSRVRGQSAIQTLIAAAIAERVQADVVIHRALTDASLRAGRITMRDVWRIVPYDNYIGVARLTIDELRRVLEENSGFFNSREFRGVYGLTYDLQPEAPEGKRVSNIRLAGTRGEEPGDPGRIRVAFNSYDMASAGGRLLRLRAILDQPASCLEEFVDVDTRAAVCDYLRRHQPLDIRAAPGVHVVR